MCVVVKQKERIEVYETQGGDIAISQTNEFVQDTPSVIVMDIDDAEAVTAAITTLRKQMIDSSKGT